jgi:hypothetical protein
VKQFLNECAKAVIGLVGAGYTAYQLATSELSEGGAHVTTAEWQNIIVASLLVAIGVWAVPNASQSPLK